MFTHPGAKLLFMGNEFGQTNEWNFGASLDWHLLEHNVHKGLQEFVKNLNHLYQHETSLYENQFNPDGFEWVEANDGNNSIYIYLRKGKEENDVTMTVLNLTPRVFDYKIGVDEGTNWEVILNSDDEKYGGSGVEAKIVDEEDDEWMYRPNNIVLQLPPLAGVVLKQKKKPKRRSTKKVSAEAVTSPEKEEKITSKKVMEKKTVTKKVVKPAAKTATKTVSKPRKSETKESIISANVVSKIGGEAKMTSKKVKEKDDSEIINRRAKNTTTTSDSAKKPKPTRTKKDSE